MKARDIHRGDIYVAKVSGRLVQVRVDGIDVGYDGRSRYQITNLATGRRIVFRSPQRFRRAVISPVAPTLRSER